MNNMNDKNFTIDRDFQTNQFVYTYKVDGGLRLSIDVNDFEFDNDCCETDVSETFEPTKVFQIRKSIPMKTMIFFGLYSGEPPMDLHKAKTFLSSKFIEKHKGEVEDNEAIHKQHIETYSEMKNDFDIKYSSMEFEPKKIKKLC